MGDYRDIAAVVAVSDYPAGRAWYSRLFGREPDLEPIENVGEWQITATAWLQLMQDHTCAGHTAVRLGVDDLDAQIDELQCLGVTIGEVVVIADLVKVLDVLDPDGNEVSFVQELRAY
ncbi:VOC family protein [Mycolicibacterium phlei]